MENATDRSIDSASTMGAAASKKLMRSLPTAEDMASKSSPEHSGPAQITDAPSGSDETRSCATSMSGSAATRDSTRSEKRSRSTARAPPAGTRDSRAQASSADPMRASSRLSMPAAVSGLVDFSELEHTSSARRDVR